MNGWIDDRRVEADLLLGLAQRGGGEVDVDVVLAPAGKRDLAGVPPQVRAPLGEDQARLVGIAIEGQQHCCVDWAFQMITWTVPPSTDQAAPAT
jgi:hypothetical protein